MKRTELMPTNNHNFTWAPFFKELAQKLRAYEGRQPELIAILKRVGIEQGLMDQDAEGPRELSEIDPFSFFSLFMKYGEVKRAEYFSNLKEALGLESPAPTGFDGVPSAQALKVWLFPFKKERKASDIPTLWKLFKKGLDNAIDDNLFRKAVNIKQVGAAKLTQNLFYINPETYLPIDSQTTPYLKSNGIDPKFSSFSEYQALLEQVKAHFGQPFYELSRAAWESNRKSPSNPMRQLIEDYKKLIRADHNEEELYKWRVVQHFQDTFDLEAEDFGANLKDALSKQYNLIFNRAVTFIRSAVEEYPERVREMFRKLLDESQPLQERFEAFKAASEAIVQDMIKREGRENISDYQDERTMAFYLAMAYPDQHYLYKDNIYRNFARLLEEKTASAGEKYFHYCELAETFRQLVEQDQELLELSRSTLTPDCFQGEQTHLLVQDILYRTMVSANDTSEVEEEEEEEIPQTQMPMTFKQPLNQILYGPPGTGKTYYSKELAVQLLDGKAPASREEVNARYAELYNAGRIRFVTFHQSTSYEDFVEGIKPNLSSEEEDGEVRYKIEDGIFKRLCVEAAFEYLKGQDKGQASSKTLTFSQLYEELSSRYQQMREEEKAINIPLKSGNIITVTEISAQGNFILQHQDGQRSYTVSKARLEKLYNEIEDFDAIPNIYAYFRSIIGGSNASAYWAVLNQVYLLQKEGASISGTTPVSFEDKRNAFERINWREIKVTSDVPKYLLIIDEINRGNIAAILGELITLLEDDKRGGNKESLEVTLPYSKTKFAVPPNLYIIGTMNTADRSVEALDTALRRRFAFREIGPQPELLAPEEPFLSGNGLSGIRLDKLLQAINARIRKLIDKDHAIGHAYFMRVWEADNPLQELRLVFHQKLLPLLQEYFYGNFGKIQLVLGKSFVAEAPEDGFEFAGDADYEGEDYNDRKVYVIQDVTQMDSEAFRDAVIKIYANHG